MLENAYEEFINELPEQHKFNPQQVLRKTIKVNIGNRDNASNGLRKHLSQIREENEIDI